MLKFSKSIFVFQISFFLVIAANAQEPTDLYVFQLQKTENNSYHIFNAQFISAFNPGGYTNQPWFVGNNDLLVSVRRKGDTQNDLYHLQLSNHSIKRLTKTAANEYSPRLDPSKEYLSMVRQVEGVSMDQQVILSRFSGGASQSITPDRRDIGYYAWIDQSNLALFRIEGEGSRLEKYNIVDQKSRKITSEIGRSLWTDGSGAVLYVHKFSPDYWYLKKYQPEQFTMDIIVQTPGETEDFAVAPDGTIFMGLNGKLLFYHPDHQTSWKEMADLSIYGIKNVTRLAISPDGSKLALVATE